MRASCVHTAVIRRNEKQHESRSMNGTRLIAAASGFLPPLPLGVGAAPPMRVSFQREKAPRAASPPRRARDGRAPSPAGCLAVTARGGGATTHGLAVRDDEVHDLHGDLV